ncbi:MAG: hypothetical protein ACYDGU_00240 [Acidiferrobacterales bacterium]
MAGLSRGPQGLPWYRAAWMFLLVVLAAGFAASADASSPPPRTALPHWSVAVRGGLTVKLIQRPIELTEAFFQGRGFTPAASRQIADACVMAAVVRNKSSSGVIRINLGDWRVVASHHARPLRLEADWRRQWGAEQVALPARIAFHYAMLPTVERLGPGDWLQGMITANLRAGKRFNLRIRWTENGVQKQLWVRNVLCSASRSQKEKQP